MRDVATAGAISALSTDVEPQTGQAMLPSACCVSNASELANQRFEVVPDLAGERIADHETDLSGAGGSSASGSAKGRSFRSAGMRCRASADLRRIDLRHDHLRPLAAALRQHLAPGRDDDRVAKGLAAVGVAAGLRGGNDEGAVLDGARPLQHMPVRLAGLAGEGGGRSQRRGARMRLRAIEVREADVVADRDAELQPRQIDDDRAIARMIDGGFAPALAVRQIDVEEMDLVVAGEDLAVAAEEKRAVGDLPSSACKASEPM